MSALLASGTPALVFEEAAVALVRDLYLAILRREPDPDGLRHYVEALTSGAMDRRKLVETFINSDEFIGAAPYRLCGAVPYELGGILPSEVLGICQRFNKFSGESRPGYLTNFLGGLTSAEVDDIIAVLHPTVLGAGAVEDYPIFGNFQGDALEWAGTLRAVLEAGGRFTMIELGAGWGPWCAVGYVAARQRGIEPIDAIAVEGDAGHVRFLRDNFRINGIPDGSGHVFHGAIGPADGTAKFPQGRRASSVYGGVALWPDHQQSAQAFTELIDIHASAFSEVEEIPCYSLQTVASGHELIDLIHCDIQGSEAMLFESAIDFLCSKVRRVVIGTHSIAIDRSLVNLFGHAGWQLEGLHGCAMGERDGKPEPLVDGTQVWRNPRL